MISPRYKPWRGYNPPPPPRPAWEDFSPHKKQALVFPPPRPRGAFFLGCPPMVFLFSLFFFLGPPKKKGGCFLQQKGRGEKGGFFSNPPFSGFLEFFFP